MTIGRVRVTVRHRSRRRMRNCTSDCRARKGARHAAIFEFRAGNSFHKTAPPATPTPTTCIQPWVKSNRCELNSEPTIFCSTSARPSQAASPSTRNSSKGRATMHRAPRFRGAQAGSRSQRSGCAGWRRQATRLRCRRPPRGGIDPESSQCRGLSRARPR